MATWRAIRRRPRTLRRVLSVSFNGLRFFPLIVLFAVGLPFFYAAALALLVNITDVLVSFSARDARWMPTRDLILSMAIALALQTAFVLHFMDDPFGAGLAMAAGSAAMLSLLLLVGLASADPGTNYRKCVASAAVAVALTAYFTLAGRSYLAHGFPSVPDARPAPAGQSAATRRQRRQRGERAYEHRRRCLHGRDSLAGDREADQDRGAAAGCGTACRRA